MHNLLHLPIFKNYLNEINQFLKSKPLKGLKVFDLSTELICQLCQNTDRNWDGNAIQFTQSSYFYSLSKLFQLICLHKPTSKESFCHCSYFVKFCLYFWTENLEEIV